jgi:hypothetical protein
MDLRRDPTMPRISLPAVIPFVLVVGGFALFMHGWTSEPLPVAPPPTTAAWRAAMFPDSAIGTPAAPTPASSAGPPAATASPPTE